MMHAFVPAAEIAAAMWPLAALSLVARSVAEASCLQLRARQQRKAAAMAAAWLWFAWPFRACCRATAHVPRPWTAAAAERLLTRLHGPRYLAGSRLVEGRVTFAPPSARPDGQRVDLGNLAASGLLSEAQEAVLEWPAVRAEW